VNIASGQRPDVRRARRTPYTLRRHDELLNSPVTGGERDHWAVSSVLDLFPSLPNWPSAVPGRHGHGAMRARHLKGGQTILAWLNSHPGNGWQERWVVSEADHDIDWLDPLIAADTSRSPLTLRNELVRGLVSLLLSRIFRPSYQFLNSYKATALYGYVRQAFRPDLFDQIEAYGHQLHAQQTTLNQALVMIGKIVLHTPDATSTNSRSRTPSPSAPGQYSATAEADRLVCRWPGFCCTRS
jgi:hypothetical protein